MISMCFFCFAVSIVLFLEPFCDLRHLGKTRPVKLGLIVSQMTRHMSHSMGAVDMEDLESMPIPASLKVVSLLSPDRAEIDDSSSEPPQTPACDRALDDLDASMFTPASKLRKQHDADADSMFTPPSKVRWNRRRSPSWRTRTPGSGDTNETLMLGAPVKPKKVNMVNPLQDVEIGPLNMKTPEHEKPEIAESPGVITETLQTIVSSEESVCPDTATAKIAKSNPEGPQGPAKTIKIIKGKVAKRVKKKMDKNIQNRQIDKSTSQIVSNASSEPASSNTKCGAKDRKACKQWWGCESLMTVMQSLKMGSGGLGFPTND